jgi:hypothetical protein
LVKRCLADENQPRPWEWHASRMCVNSQGDVIHFPAGDYITQISTPHGRAQIDGILFVWSAKQELKRPLTSLTNDEKDKFARRLHLMAGQYEKEVNAKRHLYERHLDEWLRQSEFEW